jgi:hypothetical protein
MASWYDRDKIRVIAAGGGDMAFICRRCGASLVIVPRDGEQLPDGCPACGFAGDPPPSTPHGAR